MCGPHRVLVVWGSAREGNTRPTLECGGGQPLIRWQSEFNRIEIKGRMKNDIDLIAAAELAFASDPGNVAYAAIFYITIKIDEGAQFRIGKVDIVGMELPPDTVRLREGIETVSGEVFSASALREDSQKLTERLSEDGYAFATVEPQTAISEETKTVDVLFQADRGKPVVVDRIEIEGNTKTRDKVIRREMRLQEQELFSANEAAQEPRGAPAPGLLPGGEHHHPARGGGGPDERRRRREGGADGRLQRRRRLQLRATRSSSTCASRRSTSSAAASASSLNADVGSIRRNICSRSPSRTSSTRRSRSASTLFNWRLEFDDFTRGGTRRRDARSPIR